MLKKNHLVIPLWRRTILRTSISIFRITLFQFLPVRSFKTVTFPHPIYKNSSKDNPPLLSPSVNVPLQAPGATPDHTIFVRSACTGSTPRSYWIDCDRSSSSSSSPSSPSSPSSSSGGHCGSSVGSCSSGGSSSYTDNTFRGECPEGFLCYNDYEVNQDPRQIDPVNSVAYCILQTEPVSEVPEASSDQSAQILDIYPPGVTSQSLNLVLPGVVNSKNDMNVYFQATSISLLNLSSDYHSDPVVKSCTNCASLYIGQEFPDDFELGTLQARIVEPHIHDRAGLSWTYYYTFA